MHSLWLSRRRFFALGSAALAGAALRGKTPTVWAAPAAQRATQANGLLVIVEERPSADTVAFQLSARAGSRYDGPQPGIAVITSRMMLQGTPGYPSETELQRAAASVGGTLSRGTATDTSSIGALVPSRETSLAFELLSEVSSLPLFTDSALERQRQIALQEIGQRRASPGSLVDEIFSSAMFPNHPLGSPVLGTEESLAALNRDALIANHQAFWNASNVVLAIAGRVRADQMFARAETAFADLPVGVARGSDAVPLMPLTEPRPVRGEAGQQQMVFRIGFRAPPSRDPDRYAMVVLNAIMGDTSGRLFRELRTERGLVYSAGSAYRSYTDGGTWFAQGSVDPDNLQAAVDVTVTEIERLRSASADSDELARTVARAAGEQVLNEETNAAWASQLASQQILGTDPIDVQLRELARVTPDDVQRVAQRYLRADARLQAIVGPLH